MKQSQMKQQGEDRDLGRAKLFVHTLFSFLLSFVVFGGAIVPLFLSWSRRAKKMIHKQKCCNLPFECFENIWKLPRHVSKKNSTMVCMRFRIDVIFKIL